ncbi:MAG: cupin domain-containing protein [Kiritimatiellae bacterium]|nr:cupin domain-containing protein [Kiritimatiellia bacterium]
MIHRGTHNIETEQVAGSHGGDGTCAVRTLLSTEFASPLRYVREIVLPARASVGVHEHRGDEEIYYIVAGSGTMTVDGEERRVVPGDIVLTQSGSSHGLRNDADADLKFFVACADLVK